MKNSSTYITPNFLTYANILDVLLGDYLEEGEYRTHYLFAIKSLLIPISPLSRAIL